MRPVLKFALLSLLLILLNTACSQNSGYTSLKDLSPDLIQFDNKFPAYTSFINISDSSSHWMLHKEALAQYGLKEALELRYNSIGDTVQIEILEFSDPEVAYGFLLHSSLRSQRRVWRFGQTRVIYQTKGPYLFRFQAFQPANTSPGLINDFMDRFVQHEDNPEPQVFLAFPRADRLTHGRSLQSVRFLGRPFPGAVAVQTYRDSIGYYTLARSLATVDEKEFSGFAETFSGVRNVKWGDVEGVWLTDEFDQVLCTWNGSGMNFIWGSGGRRRLGNLAGHLAKMDFLWNP